MSSSGRHESKRHRNKRKDKKKKSGRTDSTKSAGNHKSSSDAMRVSSTLFDEKIGLLNEKIELIKENESLLAKKLDLMHPEKNVKNKIVNKSKDWPYASYELCFIAKTIPSFRFLLPTMMIRLEVDGVIYGPYRALFDTGAQPTIISYTLYKRMRCVTSQTMKRVIGVDSCPFTIRRKVNVLIRPWFESDAFVCARAYILPHQNTWQPILPSTELQVEQKDAEFRNSLADPEYYRPKEVHVILGVGFIARIFEHKIGYDIDGTAVFSTQFGNVVMGEHTDCIGWNDRCAEHCNEQCNVNCLSNVNTIVDDTMNDKLHGMLQRLWKMDDAECIESKRTVEQQMVEDHFIATHRRNEEGRFIVHIPFKPNVGDIGSSRQAALKRFMYVERKMLENEKMREFYVKEMNNEISNGHIKPVTRPPKLNQLCYYIPHHCVSLDVKPRIVFDGSCKTNKGISINDVQMLGEKLQPDLHETTLRLRRFKYVVCGDIKRMFNQVQLHESQWDCQRIFWRDNPNAPLIEYWLTVVTFGLTASAYLSVRCIQQAAKEAEETLPEAARVILRDFYMDDGCTGADTVMRTVVLIRKVIEILLGAGFVLCKWKSNSREILEALNENEHTESMVFAEDGQTNILGLKWLFGKDQYTFVVKTPLITGPVTKRKIVSCVAQLYDPNGYVGPVTVIGKIIIQDLWKSKIDWDDEVDEQMQNVWNRFWSEIKYLEQFRIDRWIGMMEGAKCQIVGFSDSSKKAYGAVVYIRAVYPGGIIRCNLLMSKSRVAPLKDVTIPRLELSAAELLSRVVLNVKKSLECNDMQCVLFIDSSPALYWLRRNPKSLKTFVANRVERIQKATDLKCWKYVNTKENPADLLSRGVKPSELVGNKLWLHGPEWLCKPESEWPPEQFVMSDPIETDVEMRVNILSEFRDPMSLKKWNEDDETYELIPIVEYAPDLEKALRIAAYAIRFIHNRIVNHVRAKRATRAMAGTRQPPTGKEKSCAMEYFIRMAQKEYYAAELKALCNGKRISDKSKLIALTPKVDDKGLLRVGGRLGKAIIDLDMKHPVIIPKGSRLAWLMMDYAHRRNLHGGVQVVMQYIRQRYWIPQLRDELKKYTHSCMTCVRNKPLTVEQMMADLPADRVTPGRPFEISGVDYAGPFSMKYVNRLSQEITRVKAWVTIFVCMKTRAVHIDIVEDLTSTSFLACYECFVARRGPCYRLYSDNGTSFVGAERELTRAYAEWRTDGTVDSVAKRGTQWIFMTPGAPHQGGIYEAAVKSMKHHLKRVVGPRVMEHRQFRALLCNIEAVLNSRPITPLTDDPHDMQALTPGHFLTNGPLIIPPPFDHLNDHDLDGRKLWQERQKMLNHFWKRWASEYLATLQERKKWRTLKENVAVGQLVLIKDENLPPAQWKLGRVNEVYPDKNDVVRNVLIKTEKGEFKRPVQKICILPVDSATKK